MANLNGRPVLTRPVRPPYQPANPKQEARSHLSAKKKAGYPLGIGRLTGTGGNFISRDKPIFASHVIDDPTRRRNGQKVEVFDLGIVEFLL